jgi:hypothetical protein
LRAPDHPYRPKPAPDAVDDRIVGLDRGADAYLIARGAAFRRRSASRRDTAGVKGPALPVLAIAAVLAASGCGSAKHAAKTTGGGSSTNPAATPAGTTSTGAAGLRAEAGSAATGDIPDNQVFVTLTDSAAHYAMKYPEGWAQSGGGDRVVIRDKNNIIRVVVRSGAATIASTAQELRSLAGVTILHAPQRLTLPSGRAVKAVYSTESAPNPVTGKRVTLHVDRYYLPHGGRVAVVDLGTPVGVDNVDAYRLMIQSFRWR